MADAYRARASASLTPSSVAEQLALEDVGGRAPGVRERPDPLDAQEVADGGEMDSVGARSLGAHTNGRTNKQGVEGGSERLCRIRNDAQRPALGELGNLCSIH